VPGFVELADEESERVWHGLICLPVKRGIWTRRTKQGPRAPRTRTILCDNHNLHREYGQLYHHHPSLPCIRHTLFRLGKLVPYVRVGQTDRHFLIRGASYTLIPKPYLENAQVITLLDNAHPQNDSSVPPPACTSDWQEADFY
jgi:hypothetical protein